MKKLLIIFITLAILIGCKPEGDKKDDKKEDKPVAVVIRNMKRGNLVRTINQAGIVVSSKDATMISEVSGLIMKVFYKDGEYVKKGTVLAKIDDEMKKYSLDQAEAGMLSAETAWNTAKRNLERGQTLYEDQRISDYELENLEMQEISYYSAYKAAVSGFKIAEKQFRDTEIKATISGHIASMMIEEGNYLNMGSPVCNIVDMENLETTIGISENDIHAIEVGTSVYLESDLNQDIEAVGEVEAVSAKANSMTNTFDVTIGFDNVDGFFRPGMVLRARIIRDTYDDAFYITSDNVFEEYEKRYLYTINDSLKAERLYVTLGDIVETEVILTSGVQAGDRVVTVGAENLSDGSMVKVVKEIE